MDNPTQDFVGGGNENNTLDDFAAHSSTLPVQPTEHKSDERCYSQNVILENSPVLNESREKPVSNLEERDVDQLYDSIQSNGVRDINNVKADADSEANVEKDPECSNTFTKQSEVNSELNTEDRVCNDLKAQTSVNRSSFDRTETNATIMKDAKDFDIRNDIESTTIQEDVKINVDTIRKKRTNKNILPPSNSLDAQMERHPLLPPCQCNKRKCGDKFSYDMRTHIHVKFWTMNMYERREWTNEYLLYLKPKSRTNKPVATLHENHRKFFLPNTTGRDEVCRRMFFATLGFKDEAKFLQNPKHLNKKGMLSRTRKRKCIMSRKNLEAVEEYCREMRENHVSSDGPGASTQELVVPSGFRLRDMFNDFCTKKAVSSFGYHKFRQILELIMRGERVEDSEFTDLRDDIDEAKPKRKSLKKSKDKELENVKPEDDELEDGESEDVSTPNGGKKKRDYLKKTPPEKTPPKKTSLKKTSPKKTPLKKTSAKKTPPKKTPPQKIKTVLKLPTLSEIKKTNPRKRKRKEVFPTSSVNQRYNFRDSISVVKTYCEEDLMGDTMDADEDDYEDLSVTFADVDKDVKREEPKSEVQDDEEVTVSKAKIEKKGKKAKSKEQKHKEKKEKKKMKKLLKKTKERKKRQKTLEREEQIKFAESRKKSGVNHPVLPPCNCNLRKCQEKISANQRQAIHDEFWKMTTKQEKGKWVEKHVIHCKPRSRSNFIKFPRKHFFRRYSFPNEGGQMISVCRVFFMRTLGYHSNMTIDCLDVQAQYVSKNSIGSYEPTKKEGTNDDASEEISSTQQTAGGDLDLENNTEKNEPSCADESAGNLLDETGDSECLFGPKPGEASSCVFFTPDIEKEEVERAANPTIRRRRPVSQRNSKEHHPMREPCTCAKKCPDKIAHDNRLEIHEHYWSLITYNQRKQWILEHIKREVPKRRTVLTGPVRKKETRRCYLPSLDGTKQEVCRAFFLSTLGFKWDKMIDTICKTTPQDSKYVRADQRGKRAPIHKLQDAVLGGIKEYLESILQTIPYIPPQPRDPLKSGSKKKKNKTSSPAQSGITIKTLYADYKVKHPNQKVSYASFRKVHCLVRDEFKVQNPGLQEDNGRDNEEVGAAVQQLQDSHHSADMSASPASDNGFTYEPNSAPDRVNPNPNPNPNNPAAIPSLQSCMYNEQPQLLNLSHANNSISKANHHIDMNRLGQPSGIKFSKTQDFHLLPFSTYDKAIAKGQSMYQLPGHPPANIMPQYPSTQNNPLDPFYMASTSQAMASQAMSNQIAYSNLHFPTDLINHPHLHHPAHHHPHLYQSALPYRDHNRFPNTVLPQALKDDHNHHFYNPQMDFVQDHHHPTQENALMSYPFKDTLPYQSFTPDNVTPSPVQSQMPSQLSYPATNINMIEQRNNSNQTHPVSGFVENLNNSNTCSVSSVKISENDQLQYGREGLVDQFANKAPKQNPEQKVKKKSSKKSKQTDNTPKVQRIRKVRPLSNRNSKEHHPMLSPCTCGKKCFEKIVQSQREIIYEAFWELGTYNNRKQWIAEHMKREDPKRRTNLEALVMRKKETRRFIFPNTSDEMVEVCRLFFLHTLGLKWDKMIGTICKTMARDEHQVPQDMRGKKPPAHKLNDEISCSVDSYARALLEAAKPEYLTKVQQLDNPKKFTLDTFIPYGLTMKNLHLDYKAKHASHKVSYESFRKIFRTVRKSVLDPDSNDTEEKVEDGCTETSPLHSEGTQGTINAATGIMDSIN